MRRVLAFLCTALVGVSVFAAPTGYRNGGTAVFTDCTPVVNGLLFILDKNTGTTTIVKANKILAPVGTGRLGSLPDLAASQHASPQTWGHFSQMCNLCFSGNRLFLRTYFDLYCLGNPEEAMVLSKANQRYVAPRRTDLGVIHVPSNHTGPVAGPRRTACTGGGPCP